MVQLKEVIKKSFQHKGFSVVEAISNCHINLGRRNKMRDCMTMTRWIAEKTITKVQYEKLPPEEKVGKYPTGVLVEDTERMEYTDIYYNHVVPMAQESSKKGKH